MGKNTKTRPPYNSSSGVLEGYIEELNADPDKLISAGDVDAVLKSLGVKMPRQDVLDMIWEVDENLDECVDWDEFTLMFERNIKDTTGNEPSRFFNLVQFMNFDQDMNGLVSLDETMNMLFARYGRDKLETKMKELFGDDLRAAEGGGELTFEDYLRAVDKTFEAPLASAT